MPIPIVLVQENVNAFMCGVVVMSNSSANRGRCKFHLWIGINLPSNVLRKLSIEQTIPKIPRESAVIFVKIVCNEVCRSRRIGVDESTNNAGTRSNLQNSRRNHFYLQPHTPLGNSVTRLFTVYALPLISYFKLFWTKTELRFIDRINNFQGREMQTANPELGSKSLPNILWHNPK